MCNTLPACPEAASGRVRWAGDQHAPFDATVTIDGVMHDGLDAELGACVPDGSHRLVIHTSWIDETHRVTTREAEALIDVRAGMETLVTIAPASDDTSLAITTTRSLSDVVPLVASLDRIVLPAAVEDHADEPRLRAYAASLTTAFDAWRARLADVRTAAIQSGDVLLRAAVDDQITQADARATILRDAQPTGERLSAIAGSIREGARAAASMMAIDRICPIWSPSGPVGTSEISIEVRPRHLDALRIVHVRVAIDDVIALDAVEPEGELDQVVMEAGLVAPGEHLVEVDAAFAVRTFSTGRTVEIHRAQVVPIAARGTRLRVDVGTTTMPTTPIEEAMTIAVTATPADE